VREPFDDDFSCTWVVRYATLETPAEYCGADPAPGSAFCPKHDEQAAAMDAREAQEAP
jgi:hypothetical protein